MDDRSGVMVCVTKQKTCERLIKAGVKVREQQGGELFVVHVAPTGWNILGNSKEGEALDYLFEISKSVGANMTVLRSSEVVKSIVDFCVKNNIQTIILGESLETSAENNFVIKLSKKLCKGIEIKIIPTL